MARKSSSLSSSPSMLLSIPVDQCQNVLSYMTTTDLLTLSLVSKPVKAMAEHTHTLITSPLSLSDSSGISTSTPIGIGAVGIGIGGSIRRHNDLRHSIANVGNLDPISSVPYTTMGMRRGSLPTTDFSTTLTGSRSIRHNHSISHSDPKYRSDVMRLGNLLRKFRNLRTICLHDASSMEDQFIPLLNQCHAKSSLVHLEIHDVRIIKDEHVLHIPTDRLMHVELHGTLFCSYKVLRSFTMSDKLQTLKLNGCRALMDRDVEDIITRTSSSSLNRSSTGTGGSNSNSNCGGTLQVMALEQCSKLLSPRIQSHTLKTLSLAKNPLLRDLSHICCKQLTEVNLSYCSSLGDGNVEHLLRASPHIQTLDLSGCRGFREISIHSEDMIDLNLGMCGMHHATIHCPMLSVLEIGLCLKLQTLDLDMGGDDVKEIDLSMLPLNQLTIRAPHVKWLNLSGCCRLMGDVECLDCPNLSVVDICGTKLRPEVFQVHDKTKVRTGGEGEAYDWSEPFP